MKNLIAISLSPNTSRGDILLALRLLFSRWCWLKGEKIRALEKAFRNYFKVKYAVSFNSGRAAEYAILKAAGIKEGDGVLIQAFTCVVVPNPIIWLGAKPVWVDFEKTSLNIDLADLKKKITPQSKAVIVQHTFGKPAKIDQIKKIATENELLLIEDCAHSLGASFQDKKLGTYGQAAFFSFGRDKVISSVFGGMAVTNDDKIGKRLLEIQKQVSFPSRFWVFQQLFHPIAFSLILPLYNCLHLGKVILVGLQKLGLLSRAVSQEEKMSQKPLGFLARLPNAQATLALSQFQRLSLFNQKREKVAQLYRDELKVKTIRALPPVPGEIYMRYPIVTEDAQALLAYTKKRGVILGDWYQNLVDPEGVDLARVSYLRGSCPVAEKTAPKVVTLPTYPRMRLGQVRRVVNLIKEFFKNGQDS